MERPDFDKEVLDPLHAVQAKEAAEAEAARVAAEQAAAEAAAASESEVVASSEVRVPQPSFDGLYGSYGYALPYGNCVDEPGVNNPGWGNPIDWPVLYSQPFIGATALFGYNHTGVISGIWSNGDIELRHQNFYGGQTRFPAYTFRGFR